MIIPETKPEQPALFQLAEFRLPQEVVEVKLDDQIINEFDAPDVYFISSSTFL